VQETVQRASWKMMARRWRYPGGTWVTPSRIFHEKELAAPIVNSWFRQGRGPPEVGDESASFATLLGGKPSNASTSFLFGSTATLTGDDLIEGSVIYQGFSVLADDPNPIPEPTTMTLAALALAGAGVYQRGGWRKRRSRRSSKRHSSRQTVSHRS
jgi:hypothetical protein